MHDDESVLGIEISPRGDAVKLSSKASRGDMNESIRLGFWTSNARVHLILSVLLLSEEKPQFLIRYLDHEMVTDRFRDD